jgi:hypothetical protein
LEWLTVARPVIFFEYVPSLFRSHEYDGTLIFRDLSSIGYRYFLFFDHTGEFLCMVDVVRGKSMLSDLLVYYSNHKRRYADICAVHKDDACVAEDIRENERIFGGEHLQETRITALA